MLPRREAMRFSHIDRDGQSVAILSDSGVLWDGRRALLETMGQPQQVLTMPALLGDELRCGPFAGRMFPGVEMPEVFLQAQQVGPSRWTVRIPAEALAGHKTVLLRVRYMGDIGQAFIDGKMINDNFCNGQPWDIRLDDYAA